MTTIDELIYGTKTPGVSAPEPPKMIRTHHPFLHPTKGWRSFARPGKTNRRRKLIHQGALLVPESRAFHATHPGGGRTARGWREGWCYQFKHRA